MFVLIQLCEPSLFISHDEGRLGCCPGSHEHTIYKGEKLRWWLEMENGLKGSDDVAAHGYEILKALII